MLYSKILTSYLDEIFISPGCILHNFKEHSIFLLWDDKVSNSFHFSKKKRDIFSGSSTSSVILNPAGTLSLSNTSNQLFALSGCKDTNRFFSCKKSVKKISYKCNYFLNFIPNLSIKNSINSS